MKILNISTIITTGLALFGNVANPVEASPRRIDKGKSNLYPTDVTDFQLTVSWHFHLRGNHGLSTERKDQCENHYQYAKVFAEDSKKLISEAIKGLESNSNQEVTRQSLITLHTQFDKLVKLLENLQDNCFGGSRTESQSAVAHRQNGIPVQPSIDNLVKLSNDIVIVTDQLNQLAGDYGVSESVSDQIYQTHSQLIEVGKTILGKIEQLLPGGNQSLDLAESI